MRELFGDLDLFLRWGTGRKRGPGYYNLGNTCFMNSAMQALVHTPPLAELLLSARGAQMLEELQQLVAVRDEDGDKDDDGGSGDDVLFVNVHSGDGGDSDDDHHCGEDDGGGGVSKRPAVVLALELVRRAFSGELAALSPGNLAKSLPQLNRRFQRGQQEDCHEFLRLLLDAMHETCLKCCGPQQPSPDLAKSTFVFRIFGGVLRSQVVCKDGVDYVSKTFASFLDLSLHIEEARTVEEMLAAFTAPSVLDGVDRYRCPLNNELVPAEQWVTVEEAPAVLTLHLKRFEFNSRGRLFKIGSPVGFSAWMDLRPYMSEQRGPPLPYELYAVIVHIGSMAISGHYVCFVKAADGRWYLYDDSLVTCVTEAEVLAQRAYMLFYIRRQPGDADAAEAMAAAANAAAAAATAVVTATAVAAAAAATAATAVNTATQHAHTAPRRIIGRGRLPGAAPPPPRGPAPMPVTGPDRPALVQTTQPIPTRAPAPPPAPPAPTSAAARRAPVQAAPSKRRPGDAAAGGSPADAECSPAKRVRHAALGAAAGPAPSRAPAAKRPGPTAGGPAAPLSQPNTFKPLELMLSNLMEHKRRIEQAAKGKGPQVQLQKPKLKRMERAAGASKATAGQQGDEVQEAQEQPPPQRQQPQQQAPRKPGQLRPSREPQPQPLLQPPRQQQPSPPQQRLLHSRRGEGEPAAVGHNGGSSVAAAFDLAAELSRRHAQGGGGEAAAGRAAVAPSAAPVATATVAARAAGAAPGPKASAAAAATVTARNARPPSVATPASPSVEVTSSDGPGDGRDSPGTVSGERCREVGPQERRRRRRSAASVAEISPPQQMQMQMQCRQRPANGGSLPASRRERGTAPNGQKLKRSGTEEEEEEGLSAGAPQWGPAAGGGGGGGDDRGEPAPQRKRGPFGQVLLECAQDLFRGGGGC